MVDKEDKDASATWLPVIGRALAYLCLQDAHRKDPKKLDTVIKQVTFLEALGLSQKDAAEVAGSSVESVRVMRHQQRKSTKSKHGHTKKKARRRS